jgi:prevent-host-death family protein
VRPVSDLKKQASSVIDRVVRERRPTLITRRGKGVAVIVNLQEYEQVLDELAFIRAVKEGLRDEAEDRLHPESEALAILNRLGRSKRRRD